MRSVAYYVSLLALLTGVAWLAPAAVRAQTSDDKIASPTAPPAAPIRVLNGFVGPGYTIALTDARGDLRGRRIAAGTYRVRIRDASTIHNFELKGDGVDLETEEEFVGTVTWTVTFRAGGEYEFECDPHHHLLYGAFTAGNVPPPAPPGPPPPPPPAGGTLNATVNSSYQISLRHPNGSAVTSLRPGTYTIRVDDQAAEHNFHLSGPGVDRATTVPGTGVQTWTVTLAAGAYTYVCDPHSGAMRGSFTVANGPAPPKPPPPPAARPGVLIATVRANYTIDLKLQSGAKAQTLQVGAYTIEVRDQTKDHNFHLSGPGLDKATTVPGVGTTRWSVTLAPGKYRFVCDPHAPLMKGSFTVTAGRPQALRVSALSVRKVGQQILVRVRVNRGARAKLRLLGRSRPLAALGVSLRSGQNVRRLRIPARAGRGVHRVQLVLTDAGKRRTLTRLIRL